MRSFKILAISLGFLLLLSGAAVADTCQSFAIYTCAKGAHDGMVIGGAGSTIGPPGAGLLLSGNMFTVSDHNGESGADVVIIAAFSSTMGGTLNGKSFTALSSFPEGGATGAITTNLQETGLCGSTCNLTYGYVDLGTGLSAGGSITVTASGVPKGTAIYALLLNSNHQIITITANSESGVTDATSTVPEPGTISLMITGLCGIAGGAWRKFRG